MSINIKDNIMSPELNRTYEISLWTLQDSFIAVLGDSSSQYRGYIQDPTMQLSNDGTQELDFKLPMYIDDGITRRKSNIWAQMTNAVTIAGMRKIKVIFNKSTEDEAIYEFVITRVTDTHEQNQPMCEVHCEGLAFHELGKIGYKITLSRDEYEADNQAAWDALADSSVQEQLNAVPQPTIDYWCKKVGLTPYPSSGININSAIWYYRITMDWTAFSSGYARNSDTIYEEAYISSYNDQTLEPTSYTVYQEKQRFVEASDSNIYNLTQEIAKTFGVYCRYDYEHDTNFNITGRIVTFYNNFIDEKNRLEFTYPYTTKSITRENDCTDLVTKMYVNTVESDQSSTGLISIMDNPVNPTGEDYLLNFDYLYSIGTITDEQYKYIKEFSIQVKQLNNQILALQEDIVKRETVEVTYNAQLQVLENVIIEDTEQINAYEAYLDALTTEGKLSRRGATEIELFVVSGGVTFIDEGVEANTVKVYDKDTHDPIKGTALVLDKQNAKFATGITKLTGRTSVIVEYDYYPDLYYNEVIELYEKRLARDEKKYEALETKINTLLSELGQANTSVNTYIQAKNELLKKFERIMGPALREGNWTPEDYTNVANASYQFAGKIQTTNQDWTNSITKQITGNISNANGKLIWDSQLDYDDIDVKYVNEESSYSYYYILPLTSTQVGYIVNYYSNQDYNGNPFGLVWWDNDYTSHNRPSPVVKSIVFGSDCECAFVWNSTNNSIQPILILTDLDDVTLADINANSILYLSGITAVYNDTNDKFEISRLYSHRINDKGSIIKASSSYAVHALRFRVNDYTMLTDENNLRIWYGSRLLNVFDDYTVTQVVNTQNVNADNDGYDITIKPLSILRLWNQNSSLKINYACSQLSTAIYLDAVQILKENAYPKVTYSVDPNLIYDTFFYTDYKALNKIAFINDNELEFDQVQGYISGVNLNLDRPWEDTIEVKNYKNKFEDIFSTIVAQTESMERNEAIITNMGNSINSDGSISSENLISTLTAITLKYTSTNGSLSIGKNNGILTVGDTGAMTLRAAGLSIATNTTNSGEWAWKKAITPSGINASAITYGTLSLDKVKLADEHGNFTITNKFISGVLSINNGNLILLDNATEGSEYNAVQLIPATSGVAAQLKISSNNNLVVGNQDIKTYIEDTVSDYMSRPWGSYFQRYISIQNVDIGQVSDSRTVFVATNRLKLGKNNLRTLLYYEHDPSVHVSSLSIGPGENPIICDSVTYNSSETQVVSSSFTIAGWSATVADGLITKDLNNNIISQVNPNILKIDDYIKTFVEGSGNTTGHAVQIKKLYLEKGDNDTDHIVTFINNGTGEVNYLLKINSEGLHYSLDNGTTWNKVAIDIPVEPEPEPEPEEP